MPVSGVTMPWWPLLLIGFTVGVVGGYFGLGGAWLVTPALNIFGFPMIYAVGTDMAHIMGKSIVATFRHWKFGHVSPMVALVMLLGTFSGIEVGAQFLFWLTQIGMAGDVVRYMYMGLLAFLAVFILTEYAREKKKEKEAGAEIKDVVGTPWSRWIHQTLDVAPRFYCKVSKTSFSIWSIIFVGWVVGVVAGILGIGGGLIRVPALIYLVGFPTKIAVGTDLFEVAFSGAYGTLTYSLKGGVELIAAVIMLVGAAIGAQFGTITTKYVYGLVIRLVFGIAVIFAFTSVATRQYASILSRPYRKELEALLAEAGLKKVDFPAIYQSKDKMYHWCIEVFNRPEWYAQFLKVYAWTTAAGILMMTAATGLCLFILYQFALGVQRERAKKSVAG
ncbi:MAG: sulfite exporter TauE/SafE family protein [Bacillota bacterium]